MPMPNRKIVNGEPYRYAYQGQEVDPETGKPAFQLRLWDARIGRWLTTDPYGQFHSPYLGMGNDPVNGIDPDGGIWKPIYDSNGKNITALRIKSLKKSLRLKRKSLKKQYKSSNDIELKERANLLKVSLKQIKDIHKDKKFTVGLKAFSGGNIEQVDVNGVNSVTVPFDISSVSNIALTIHEIGHAHQAMRGELSIITPRASGSGYFLQSDQRIGGEVESYRFQYAYDPTSMPVEFYRFNRALGTNVNFVDNNAFNSLSRINFQTVRMISDGHGNPLYGTSAVGFGRKRSTHYVSPRNFE